MSKICIYFWWDTEDFVTPESDDIILDVVRAFDERGVRACFKMVGEKVRMLEKCGRTDVIKALERHEIGYHTNWHSVHPTPAETANGKRWAEGIEALRNREEPGFRDVVRVFRRTPEVYGQPGASYTPQYYRLMRDWHVPTYEGSSVYLGLNDRPSYFQGIFNLAKMWDVTANPSTRAKPGERDPGLDRLDACVRKLSATGGAISSGGHPCEYCTTMFWDGVNFAKGANPPRDQWRPAPLRTPEDRAAVLARLGAFLDECQRRDLAIVTAAEVRAMYPDKAVGMRVSRAVLKDLAAFFAQGIQYYETCTWAMTAGEVFSSLVNCVCETGRRGTMPDDVGFVSIDGPDERGRAAAVPAGSLTRDALIESAGALRKHLERTKRLPDDVMVAGRPVRPVDYAALLASAVEHLAREGRLPDQTAWREGSYPVGGLVRGLGEGLNWIIHPPEFKGETLKDYTLLQAWSFKPAILAG